MVTLSLLRLTLRMARRNSKTSKCSRLRKLLLLNLITSEKDMFHRIRHQVRYGTHNWSIQRDFPCREDLANRLEDLFAGLQPKPFDPNATTEELFKFQRIQPKSSVQNQLLNHTPPKAELLQPSPRIPNKKCFKANRQSRIEEVFLLLKKQQSKEDDHTSYKKRVRCLLYARNKASTDSPPKLSRLTTTTPTEYLEPKSRMRARPKHYSPSMRGVKGVALTDSPFSKATRTAIQNLCIRFS